MLENDPAAYLTWEEIPELRGPNLLMGFYGWPDAGGVSGDTLEYLLEMLKPVPIGAIRNEPFFNFTTERPTAEISSGLIRTLDPGMTRIYGWRNPKNAGDLILLISKEPEFNWTLYTRVILEIIKKLDVTAVVTVGGVQDAVSHSSRAVISVVGSDTGTVTLTTSMFPLILRPSEYAGPVSIHSYLIKACAEWEKQALSLWGHVPAYLNKNPATIGALITILNRIMNVECPIDELIRKAVALERRIDEAIKRDPKLKQLVETIEGREQDKGSNGEDDNVIQLKDFHRRDPRRDPEQ